MCLLFFCFYYFFYRQWLEIITRKIWQKSFSCIIAQSVLSTNWTTQYRTFVRRLSLMYVKFDWILKGTCIIEKLYYVIESCIRHCLKRTPSSLSAICDSYMAWWETIGLDNIDHIETSSLLSLRAILSNPEMWSPQVVSKVMQLAYALRVIHNLRTRADDAIKALNWVWRN